MLHFFRKIRRNLLENGKSLRYLKYAIGEIFLVIIGILIALQVNNWNEERIAAEKNKILFQEVSEELVLNIENIDRVLDLYLNKDPIYFKVLNKMVEPEDYRVDDDIFSLLLNWDQVSIVDDDFKALLTEKNNLTELQDSLFAELKDLYGTRKKNTDQHDQMVNDVHLNFRDKLMAEQPWWSSYSKSFAITDENFDEITRYALTDPFYLNQIGDIRLREGGQYHGILWFRTKAMDLYERITKVLNIAKDNSLFQDITNFENLKGVYSYGDLKGEISGEHELEYRIYLNDSIISEWDIYPYSRSYLIINQDFKDANFMFRIVFGENEKDLGLIFIQDMKVVEGARRMWKKIE